MVKPLDAEACLIKAWDGAQYVTLYGQQNVTLTPSRDTYELKHKTSDGWVETIAGYRSWTVDCDGLMYMADDDEFHSSLLALWESWEADPGDANLQIELYFAGGKTVIGYGVLTSMPMKMPEGASTFSATFKGSGVLTRA